MKPFATGKSAEATAYHPQGGCVRAYWVGRKAVMKRQVRRARRRLDAVLCQPVADTGPVPELYPTPNDYPR